MLFAFRDIEVETCLLKRSFNSLLHLFEASLFNSNVEFVVFYFLSNTAFVDSERSSRSYLHSNVLTNSFVSNLAAQSNKSAEAVVVSVVVSSKAFTFNNEVSVEFHFFASHTRLVSDAFCNCATIECQSLNFFYVLATCYNSSIENVLCQSNEISILSHEVSFALKRKDSTIVAINLYENATFSCFTIRTLSSDSLTALAHEFNCSVEIAFSFSEGILTIAQTSTSQGAELLDIFNIYSHFACILFVGIGKKENGVR